MRMSEPKTTPETAAEIPEDIAAMSFEEAMAELETIIDTLDGGEVPLEESITIYERGAALQRHCEDKLRQAEMRVQKIVARAGGTAERAEPASFD